MLLDEKQILVTEALSVRIPWAADVVDVTQAVHRSGQAHALHLTS